MTKNEVKAIFTDYPVLVETNEVKQVVGETKIYGTNRTCGSWIMFDHKRTWSALSDWCVIYFDTNNVIIAYEYLLMH
jgi:hypothetical protein